MKNAIVTGASTGIGRAAAVRMSEAGYHVFLVARSQDKLEETADIIAQHGGFSTVITSDLSVTGDVNLLISTVLSAVETVDAVVNIAGIWHGTNDVYAGKDFELFDQQVILDTYHVGFTTPTLLIHGLLPIMRRGSKIVNLSGTFENGAKGWLPYFASKRAIEDFTVGLAQELERREITVNCISPSDTATESYAKFFPEYMEDAMSPQLIAEKIVELCSPESSISGQVIVMKSGILPSEGFHQ